MINIVADNLYFSVPLVRLALKVVMQNDRDFMEVMLLYHTTGLRDRDWELIPNGRKRLFCSPQCLYQMWGSAEPPVEWMVGEFDIQRTMHLDIFLQ